MTEEAGAAMKPAGRARQVLIIDDDPHIAETMVAALKNRYQVHVATDDREGLAILRRHPIDLVLLDVRLRSSDGLEALGRLRAARDCRVLVLTGFGSDEVLLRALRAKVDDYMDKPFNVFELQARVAALLGEMPKDGGPLCKVHHILLYRFDEPHTTMSLARVVGLSTSHLRRRFKAAFGLTPMACLERVRMEEAVQFMKDGALSIKEVARKVGYRDANNFSTAFKRFYGTSPQSHRGVPTSL
ncbi:MAG: helix-turn-helix domain-containing protein [candidate division NC10 bacterium]|nr:helix-turn-helix domain-containing protein [candidate division NC10 bacterium]